MSSFTDYLENAVLNHVLRNVPLPAPTVWRVALFTVSPTDAGGGTEVSTGGYARQAVAFGAPSAGVTTNTGAVSFTASGAAFGTVVAMAIFDAASAGNMLAWAPMTSAVVNNGDTLTFAIGQISVTLT